MSASRVSEPPSPAGGASLPSPAASDSTRRRVSYFYEPTIGDYYYGQGHPMKPHRIRMAHCLVVHYRLHRSMEIIRPYPAAPEDLLRFHHPDYVSFLAESPPNTVTGPTVINSNATSSFKRLHFRKKVNLFKK